MLIIPEEGLIAVEMHVGSRLIIRGRTIYSIHKTHIFNTKYVY